MPDRNRHRPPEATLGTWNGKLFLEAPEVARHLNLRGIRCNHRGERASLLSESDFAPSNLSTEVHGEAAGKLVFRREATVYPVAGVGACHGLKGEFTHPAMRGPSRPSLPPSASAAAALPRGGAVDPRRYPRPRRLAKPSARPPAASAGWAARAGPGSGGRG